MGVEPWAVAVALPLVAGESVVEVGFVRRVVVGRLPVAPDRSVVAVLAEDVAEQRSCFRADFGIEVRLGPPEFGTEDDSVVDFESPVGN